MLVLQFEPFRSVRKVQTVRKEHCLFVRDATAAVAVPPLRIHIDRVHGRPVLVGTVLLAIHDHITRVLACGLGSRTAAGHLLHHLLHHFHLRWRHTLLRVATASRHGRCLREIKLV